MLLIYFNNWSKINVKKERWKYVCHKKFVKLNVCVKKIWKCVHCACSDLERWFKKEFFCDATQFKFHSFRSRNESEICFLAKYLYHYKREIFVVKGVITANETPLHVYNRRTALWFLLFSIIHTYCLYLSTLCI